MYETTVKTQDFLGGPVVMNLPANAEGTASIPDLKIFYMPEDNWACVSQLLKPVRLEPRLQNKRSQGNVKPENCKEEQTPLPQLKKSLSSARKTQSSQKQIENSRGGFMLMYGKTNTIL